MPVEALTSRHLSESLEPAANSSTASATKPADYVVPGAGTAFVTVEGKLCLNFTQPLAAGDVAGLQAWITLNFV